MEGTYWADAGLELRKKLSNIMPEQIENDYAGPIMEANNDLRSQIPVNLKEAKGIKILSKVA